VEYQGIEVISEVLLQDGLSEKVIQGWISAVLNYHGLPQVTTLTCVISRDEQLQALNREYRGLDEPTDVLSFSANEGSEFITPEDQAPYLGDIIISLQTAERQASEAGHPLEKELALLAVHGCLHLLGYDHADEAERARMWQVQDQILKQLGEAD